MADQLPAGLTPDESSFQPIGASSGSGSDNSAPPQGLSGDESSFQPISSSGDSGSQPQSFTTPGGSNYQVGQSVQHSDGTHGEVTGQHPETGNAVVKWHMGAENFKPGMLVRVDGHSGVVSGKTTNGKVIVDWGDKGTSSVSPGDIEAPGTLGSFVAGVGKSLANTVAGGAKLLGQHSSGLDESQRQINDSTAVNPASGKTGELAADLVQFLALNGMVKPGTGTVALKASERYANAAKIVKALEEHPLLRKIVHAGINGAATQGTISGVQSGGDLGEAAKGAALGATGETLGEFAPEIAAGAKKVGSVIAHPLDAAGSLVQGATDKLGQAAEKYIPELYPKKIEVPSATEHLANVENATAAPSSVEQRLATQPTYDQHIEDIKKATVNALKEKGIDLQIPEGTDIRKVPDMAIKSLENVSRPLYAQVDEALEKAGVDTKYQALEDEVKQKTFDMRSEPDVEKKAKLGQSLLAAKAQLGRANEILEDNGLGDTVKKASDLYKQAKAMEDFKVKLIAHTQDLGGTLPRVNPDGLNKSLNNLKFKKKFNGSRLDQAFGPHGDQLIADTRAAQSRVTGLKDSAAQAAADRAATKRSMSADRSDLKAKAAEVEARRAKTENIATKAAIGAAGLGAVKEGIDLFKK